METHHYLPPQEFIDAVMLPELIKKPSKKTIFRGSTEALFELTHCEVTTRIAYNKRL